MAEKKKIIIWAVIAVVLAGAILFVLLRGGEGKGHRSLHRNRKKHRE